MTQAELDRASGIARGIRVSIYDGDTDSLLRFRDNVPWSQLMGRGNFHELVNNAGVNFSDRSTSRFKADAALSVLLGWAERDRQPEAFALKENDSAPFPQPVKGLIENGMTRSLVRFLDNGFDPYAKRGPEGIDAFQWAERTHQHGLAMAMMAHGARGRAHDFINDMQKEASSKVTP